MKPTLIAIALIVSAGAAAAQSAGQQIVVPLPDAERGRFLFASKGCVVCHSVNGIGGAAGPALDAEEGDAPVAPLEFAARMWRGASAMALLQSLEFGYQIDITGDEIADLAAFLSNRELQGNFSERDVPEMMQGWTIDEPFPEIGESWSDWGPGAALDGDEDESLRIGNMTRGYMLAERWCTTCHVVDLVGEGGDVGPAFPEIAARPEVTEEGIQDWLSVPHPTMPEFINLTEKDFQDLAAYILSLKQ